MPSSLKIQSTYGRARSSSAGFAQTYGLARSATIYQDTLRELYDNQISHVYLLSEPDLPIID